jgi:hypothetical protein
MAQAQLVVLVVAVLLLEELQPQVVLVTHLQHLHHKATTVVLDMDYQE